LLFGINGDSESQSRIDAFVRRHGVTFPIVHDRDTQGLFNYPPHVGLPYPRDVVVGRDLRIRSIKRVFRVDEQAHEIESLLAEP
jgi:peroxiredoxin